MNYDPVNITLQKAGQKNMYPLVHFLIQRKIELDVQKHIPDEILPRVSKQARE